MALRWCAAGMVEAGKQFRRVNGHLHLPALRAALERDVAENVRPVVTMRTRRRLKITGPPPKFNGTRDILGQRVAHVSDPTQDRTDRYGRTLAYLVRADGWDLLGRGGTRGRGEVVCVWGRPREPV